MDNPDAAGRTPCNADGNLCTIDHCDRAGHCVFQSTVACSGPTGECDAGQSCDPSTGGCIDNPDPTAGAPCNADGDLCTVDQCDGAGDCVVGPTCTPPEVCNPVTGCELP